MKKTLSFLALVISLLLVGCSKEYDGISDEGRDEPPHPMVTLDSSVLDFTVDGGSKDITFKTNEAWTAEVVNSRADGWCSITPESGFAGDAKITVTTIPNDMYDDRSAFIIIKVDTITEIIAVNQKQQDALTITSSKFEVEAGGGELEIEVKSNIDFEFYVEESAKEWIKYEATRAMATSNLVFMISKNDDADKREGKVIIESGLQKEIITIYQVGSDPIIVLSKNEYVVSSVGETIDVDVKNDVDIVIDIPVDVDWITENTARAASTNTYRFDIAANDDYNQREADVLFIDNENNLTDTVKVVQAPKDAIILSDLEYSIDRKGGDLNVEITSNVDFDIAVSEPWITIVEAKSLKMNTLHFYVSACDDLNDRAGTITFTNGNVSQTISIRQDGILSEEKDALVAFYHATNGGNWGDDYGTIINNGWLSDEPVGEWYGVETDSEGRVIKLSFVLSNLSGYITTVH